MQANPYLEIFEGFPCDWKRSGPLTQFAESKMDGAYRKRRDELCCEYSYSVPTEEALDKISQHCPALYDFGAGSGYWASLLEGRGVQVTGYEPFPAAKVWHESSKVKAAPSNESLFLSWPLPANQMAMEALTMHSWRKIVYVGEILRGCGTPDFFNLLWQTYDLLDYVKIPQWLNRSDAVYLFGNN